MSGTCNLLGIDLGTSSVRAGVFRENGRRLSVAARAYPIEAPSPEISEQNPELWWIKTCEAVRETLALAEMKGSDITGISFSGQMHGGVMLDRVGKPVGRAIIGHKPGDKVTVAVPQGSRKFKVLAIDKA